MGTIKSNLDFGYNESAKRQYIANLGLKQAPGIIIEPNTSEEDMIRSVVDFIFNHGMFYRLLFKINDTIQSFGCALVKLEAHHRHFLIKLEQQDQYKEITKVLMKLTTPIGEKTYSVPEFYTNFLKKGGIIEFRPVKPFVQEVLVFFEVQPDENVIVLGTGELINENSVSIGIVSPTQIKEIESAIQSAKAIVSKLISEYNFTGSFSCEFIRFENDNLEFVANKGLLWVTNFYPYFTQYHNYFLFAKYSARSIDLRKNTLAHVPPFDQKPKFKYLKQVNGYDISKVIKQNEVGGNYSRVAIYVWGLHHDYLKFIKQKTIVSICINNQILLTEDGTGTLINSFGSDNDSIFAMLVLMNTFESTIDAFVENLQKFGKSLLELSNNFKVSFK
jgi:hypothetical protein